MYTGETGVVEFITHRVLTGSGDETTILLELIPCYTGVRGQPIF
jgi:hypothetical protein